MKFRAVALSVALLSASVAAPAALAAKKPAPKPLPKVCNLITDPTGDASYNNAPGSGGDDLTGGDVASDGKVVTAVIRVASLTVPDPQWLPGRNYVLYFATKGSANTLFLAARTYPQGTQFSYGYQAPDPTSGINTNYKLGDGTGTVDTAKNEVHITAPLSAFSAAQVKLTPGTKLIGLDAQTQRIAGQGLVPSQSVAGTRVPIGGLLLQFDDAAGAKPYVIGQPSCVKAGS